MSDEEYIDDPQHVPEEEPPISAAVGFQTELLTGEQVMWLTRGLEAGATREIACAAAGIDDLEEIFKVEPGLERYCRAIEARAEIGLLRELAESRPGFILERLRPERYGPLLGRNAHKDEDDTGDLFGDED